MDLIIETVYLSPMTKRHYLKNLRITPPNLLKNISLKSSFLWIDMLLAVFVTIVGLYIIKNGMILSFWHTPNVMSYLKWFWVHRDHWPQALIAVISVKGILTIFFDFILGLFLLFIGFCLILTGLEGIFKNLKIYI
jgi:hypothetical protein